MSFKVYPHNQHSRGAKALSRSLNGRVLLRQGSRYRDRGRDTIINWGAGDCPFPGALNANTALSNKLVFFEQMQGNEWLPPFWTNTGDIPDDAFPIVCRTVLNGHSGNGIVIANNREELVPCRLYVQYKKKADEYRVHVGTGQTIIDVQQKRKRRDLEGDEVNFQVRNHENGYVYCREDLNVPECVTEAALSCLEQTGDMDFGAVDVIYNRHYNQAWVLEINSAPGLEGTTVEKYRDYFNGEYG